ncbi:Oidioi.mRNA.OKI2018_I69.chr1.g568.t1.cds [Oikopleura dioica]|uniref:Oidioi.mRNA.OKI2018_I69.chr1.g568.t1.cds n=1 Tax=Oikopleura dioica TaxID=34765 RepID=A0ABN7SK88_OIKDI|nr:Oidioi.mRNA.OKI2018_I69.chr1.g568.t1.cds [Oikopleura dioica]
MGNPSEEDPPPSYPSAPLAGEAQEFSGYNPNYTPPAQQNSPQVITSQPPVQNPPGAEWPFIKSTQPKDWKYNCFEAFCSGSECCVAWCCPCMSIAKTAEMLGLDGNRAFCCAFWGHAFTLAFQQRELIRLKYNIPSKYSGCADFWCLFCCWSCTLAQSSLQLKYELLQNRQ